MNKMSQKYKKVEEAIKNAENTLVVSHRKPDADTLGAAVSVSLHLDRLNKPHKLACVDKPSSRYSFIPKIDQFVSEFCLSDFDLVIVLDAGASYMTNFHLKYKDFFNSGALMVNIDHHASNDNFGDINIVEPEAASVTEILTKMFSFLGIEISQDMATCLLAGIYSDTGSFMHSNTSKTVLKTASYLMEKGAKIKEITKYLFKNNSVEKLKMWGRVMEKSFVTDQKVVMSVVKEEDYNDVGASPEHLSGVVDYLNMIPNTKFAVLVNEDREGNVKGSFRTRCEEVDLSKVAAVFGGGGHPKASGFNINGKLKEKIEYEIVYDDMSKQSLKF